MVLDTKSSRLRTLALGAFVLALGEGSAFAYPTAVVFAPTGDVKGPGDAAALAYYGWYFKPSLGPGPTWIGLDVGLIPKIPYGKSGFSFGGLEIGVDALSPDLQGTPSAFIKPIFNAKLQVLTESTYIPNIAIGAMQIDPFRMERSMNLVYGSLTKTLEFGGTNYGRLTLGLGGALLNPGNDPYKDSYPVFYATAPFPRESKLMLIGGYESPTFGPFNIGIDHIGGYSEVSSTNVVLNFMPFTGGTLGIGGFFGSDPKAFYGGMFAYLYLNFNVIDTFKKKEPAPQTSAP